MIFSFIPALVFINLFKYTTFRVAIVISFTIGLLMYASVYKVNRRFTPLNIFGMIGLFVSSFIEFISDNPMTVFIYPLVSNTLYSLIFLASYFTKNDLVSVLAKSFFENDNIYDQCRPALRKLTLIWGIFYAMKLFIKITMLRLDSFEVMYGINWITGYPITLLLTYFSYKYPNNYYFKVVYPKLSDEEKPLFESKNG